MKIIFDPSLKTFFGLLRSLSKNKIPYEGPIVFASEESIIQPSSVISGLMLKKYYIDREKGSKTNVSERDLQGTIRNHSNGTHCNCHFCGTPVENEEVTFDHYIPLFYGGEDNFTNLRLACKACNYMKGGIHPTNMPVTWSLFLDKQSQGIKTSAYKILLEAKDKELGEYEKKQVLKLIVKEEEWRSEKHPESFTKAA